MKLDRKGFPELWSWSEPSLIVKHFPPEWLGIWTPEHQLAFHIPTGEIMPMADERCPIIVIDWGKARGEG